MQELRVFEFAKEVGIETLALMDKLRKWDIAVKSHMATLDAETIEQIKQRMAEEEGESGPKKKTAKKKAVRKKAAGKGAKKVVRTRKASEVAEAAAAAAAEEEAAAAKQAASEEAPAQKKVVRRKTTDVEQEAPVEVASAEPQQEAPAATEENQPEAAAKDTRPKNIIGRMDLSKVDSFAKNRYQKPQDRSSGSGGYTPNRGGYSPDRARPIGAGLNTRTNNAPSSGGGMGMRQAMIDDIDASMGMDNKKDKGRKRLATKQPSAEEGPRAVPEGEQEAFIRTDFRKREIIFQPKKKKVQVGPAKKTEITKAKASKRVIKIFGATGVADVAQQLKIKPGQLISTLMKQGVTVKATDTLDFDTIALIAPEFEYEAVNVERTPDELADAAAFGNLEAEPQPRAPVVTVMGHVDHGKTSLLDAIRSADVASGEAGGITQHIGAYSVKLADGRFVTFLDTPGHEAFTAMRARGANATDIAVIVIAADDGVMPQTAEAINHAKAAGVPLIIAMNKMDRPGANADKIKQQVMEFELVSEEWGGTTMFIGTSAVKKTGIKELLEAIHLQAEILELKANPERSAKGLVIESKVEKGRGVVCTLLVKEGTLRRGDEIVAGCAVGRVKALSNYKGEQIKEAGPGVPVEVLGLDITPEAGDRFDVTKDDKSAQEIAKLRIGEKKKAENVTPNSKMSLEELFSKVQQGEVQELPVVLKSDVAGSIEAIKSLFEKVATSKVKVKVIHAAVGGVTESDVMLASSASAVLVGFNVRPDGGATIAAKREGVQIKTYSIIYELADDIKLAMKGMLAPKVVEEFQGRAEVREIFKIPNAGTVAGSFVTAGKIHRDDFVRLSRDGKQIYEGDLGGLRRFKDTVKEVAEGYECGITIANFNDIKVGDVIESFKRIEVEAELE
ncbi:MAG: translation initiation factor IF-2 [Bdellovibrionales bacterium]|nr:translation initiation factor IF-2 [Bdellovibrionales bacterium]